MSKIYLAGKHSRDEIIGDLLEKFSRKVEVYPPGTCPLTVQLSLLHASMNQTCGKCVPCRDGLPQLAKLLEKILNGVGSMEMLDKMKEIAIMIRDSADCAIGYQSAIEVLEGLETFASEYESHIRAHECPQNVGQKVPCVTLCPAHVDIPGYIAHVHEGNYADAINLIRRDNPLPTACAMICEHPCEERCRRNLIDDSINIRGIKKYAVDQIAADQVAVPKANVSTGKKVAVIGGGPSGLTCAYFCALMGHEVHVFERRKHLGGMMRYGIPAYRFPRERLDEDIRAILSTGDITVHYESDIDTDTMAQISKDYDACYVAIGAQGGKSLRMEGSDAEGVMSAVELLTEIGEDNYPDFTGKKVVVIGGGNVAMDCARTSVRAGAESVTIAYRRRIEDMTALRSEIDSAMQEGVEMCVLQAHDHIEVENGHCTALYTQPQMIGPVKGGRPTPQKANKPLYRIEADIILIAVGQSIESEPFEQFGMEADRTYFQADEHLKALHGPDNVFVGGDCQVGPKTVIVTIGAGKVAARNIDDYLGFDHELDCGATAPAPKPNNRVACGRVNLVERPAYQRKHDFDAVEVEMSLEEAQQECGRCLRCDHYGCGVMEGGRVQYV